MNPKRIGGLVLLGCGAALSIIGINALQSVVDSRWNTFLTWHIHGTTAWSVIAGIMMVLAGLCIVALNGNPSEAKLG